jgi:hypothetical protein
VQPYFEGFDNSGKWLAELCPALDALLKMKAFCAEAYRPRGKITVVP